MNDNPRLNEPEVIIPVSLLLKIFNAIPKENGGLRAELIGFLRSYKENMEEKGHVVEGFRITEDGTLVFEESLYDEAIYRGKIETYSRALYEKIEKLKSDVALLKSIGEAHQKALGDLPPEILKQRVGEGRKISEEEIKLLYKIMPAVLSVSDTMDKD